MQNRVIRFHDIRTPDGGIVSVYEDVGRERSVEATLGALAKTLPGANFELRRDAGGTIACSYVSERIIDLTGLSPRLFAEDWGQALSVLLAQADADRLIDLLDDAADRLD